MFYRLKEIRVQRGITQVELGRMAQVTRATISKIESGEEVKVKISTLERLASVLQCKVSDLMCA